MFPQESGCHNFPSPGLSGKLDIMRMTTVLCLFGILVFAVNGQVFPSLLPRLGGSSIEQGFLLSSLFLLFPFSSAVAGYIADRTGKRIILLVGSFLMALPFALSAIWGSLWVRSLAVMLFGIGGGIVEGQVTALLSDANPGKERSVTNLSQVFFAAGASGGPVVIMLLFRAVPGISVSTILWVPAAMATLLFLGFFSLPKARTAAVSQEPMGLKQLVTNRMWLLLCITLFMYVAAEMGTVNWLAQYGKSGLGLPDSLAPLGITLFWAGLGMSRLMTATILSGRLSDRTLLLAAFSLSLIARLAAFTTSIPWLAIGFFFVMGFGMGSIWPTIVAIAGANFRSSSGAAIGILIAAGGLAIPVIQTVIGWLSSLIGLRLTLLSLGVLSVANIVIFARMKGETHRRSASPEAW